jgi:dolichol kinase
MGSLCSAARPGRSMSFPRVPAVPAAYHVCAAGSGGAALYLSLYLLDLPPLYGFVPACMVLAGHRFVRGSGDSPLTAPALALYAFAWATALCEGSFDPLSWSVVLTVGFLLAAATRSREATGMALLFSLALLTALKPGFGALSATIVACSLLLLAAQVSAAETTGFFRVYRLKDLKPWRIIARPFALLFIVIDILWTRKLLLLILGLIALLFIILDLVRLAARLELRRFFKSGESNRFSSMTSFLVAVFIMFLVFPDYIPYLGLACLTMGDLFSKFVGIKYGGRTVIGRRTWEGTAAYFCGSLLFGYALHILLDIPLAAVGLASFGAAATELCSGGLDDNFTVGIVSGAFLAALRHFSAL